MADDIVENREEQMAAQTEGSLRMSEELIQLLRHRVAARYYDQPQVIDMIARAILHSRGLYPAS